MSQINFEFDSLVSFDRDSLIVGSSNDEAVAWIDKWPEWKEKIILIYGERSSGKTHLLHCWAKISKANIIEGINFKEIPYELISKNKHLAIDNASKIEEELFLHFINIVLEEKGTLFIADRKPPAFWNIKLPDLKSRLLSISSIELRRPDDILLQLLMSKLFQDKQLQINKDVITYAISRIERSYEAVNSFVEDLDYRSLNQNRSININLAREVLDRIHD
ncbi:DnaA/Hda family protein [Alphaproteobacteria bacterium]|nr:DnaA/Hda family protein [Alphaproteobacteria bacterium]